MSEFKAYFDALLKNVEIATEFNATKEAKAQIIQNHDVRVWLSKVGHKTKPGYVTGLSYFLRCTNITDPTELLDLKSHEDREKRFFPAEALVDYWLVLAKEHKLKSWQIKKTLDSVRSFFKKNRVPLVGITYTHRPLPKPTLSKEELLRFREAFTWQSRILFDFLTSVPLRTGQFQKCPNCSRDFYPRWQHILTYPKIEAYSPFVIQPEKGHGSKNYNPDMRQVCFLTETAARQLNSLRKYKERLLARALKPMEYIFTYSQHSRYGEFLVSPIGQQDIIMKFRRAQQKTGIKVYAHLLRSWVNSVLAAQGIDKQLRDLYLGHNCAYEQGYILQLIPLWRQTYMDKHATEALDVTSPSQHQVIKLEQQVIMREQENVDLKRRLSQTETKLANLEDETRGLKKLMQKVLKQT